MTQRLTSTRLTLEILGAVAISETIIMFLLPLLFEDPNSVLANLVDGLSLTLLAGSIIARRVRAGSVTWARDSQCRVIIADERLAEIARRTSDAVIVTDPEWRILWVNEGFTRVTGYELSEVAGKTPAEVLHGPETDSVIREKIRSAMAARQPISSELVKYAKGGRRYIASLEIAPTTDSHGEFSGFMAVESDVTERVTRERALAESEARLRAIIDGTDLFTWEFCVEEDCFTFLSFDHERLGFPRSDWLQPGFWDSKLHPDDRETTTASCVASIQAGKAHHLDYRMIAADGSIMHISDYVSAPEKVGGRTIVRGVAVDVSEMVRAREKINEQAERLDIALSATGLGLFDWNPQSGDVVFSEGWAQMIGFHVNELPPQVSTWSDRVHPDDLPLAKKAVDAAMTEGLPYNVEFRMRHRDGTWRWHHAQGRVVARDSRGAAVRFVGTQRDITEQKQAAEALRIERERLDLAVNGSDLGLWDWNPKTGSLLINERWAQMVGYTASELPANVSVWSERVHPDDLPAAIAAIKDAMQNNTLYRNEHRLRHRDGSWRWNLDQGRIVARDADGEVIRFVGTHQDITERKESEQQQLAVAAMLDSTARLARIGAWEIDVATGAIKISDMVYDIYELPRGMSMTRELALDFYPPGAHEQIAGAIEEAMHSGAGFDLELPLITTLGRMIWVRTIGQAITKNGKVVTLSGAIQDITAAREAAAELRNIKESLEEAQSVTRMGNWSFDLRTQQVLWSRQLYMLFNRDPAAGPPSYEDAITDYSPEDSRRLDTAFKQTAADGTPFTLTMRTAAKNPSVRFIRGEGRARRDASGAIVELYGTAMDVTAEMEREEALRVARTQAEAASRSKSEFLANMSHEIRTPLTAILGFTDLLREDPGIANSAERIQTIDTIKNAGAHLLTVINDILDLSKIEADKMSVERIDTPVVQILRDVVSLMKPRAAGKGVALTASLECPIPDRIFADPTRLRQILMNLTGNAAKFTEAGSIRIIAGIDSRSHAPRLTIDVQDTGPGMTFDQTNRLFQAFGQADGTVTRKFGGTGLGLMISRRLANMMGGDVKLLRTKPGEGSTFRLVLPLEPVPGAAMIDQIQSSEPAPNSAPINKVSKLSGRILLAEDGPDNQRLISFHLRRAGATVEIADNGRIALEMISRAAAEGRGYDLLLTDMQMPELDGYALARELRAAGSPLPIIALTAHAMAEDRSRCLQAGCDDYTSKPIDKDRLLNTCAAWIGAARARSAA